MNRDMEAASSCHSSLYWVLEGEEEEASAARWSAEDNKKFENALAYFDQDTPDRWHNVASMVPGKTVSDVIKQYRDLVRDVRDIEDGRIPIPGYVNNGEVLGRRKGVPWSEQEHRQFLLGLRKFGKGDWRNISRNFVTTRTPTQVASHAQKYFIRQHSGDKDKKRSSIHDITMAAIDDANSSQKQTPDSGGAREAEAMGFISPEAMAHFQLHSSEFGQMVVDADSFPHLGLHHPPPFPVNPAGN